VIVVSGGDLILPGRVVSEGSLVIDGGRIVAIEPRRVDLAGATIVDAGDCYVAPGFIDVHVHGLHGYDTLDGEGAVARIAAVLPRYGVTAFCPTTVACAPDDLRVVLEQVRHARLSPIAGSARVLPAHLESNFINPEYKGAQPADCLRTAIESPRDGVYSGRDVLGRNLDVSPGRRDRDHGA
jgi:N-acetylglucosamine-6-phosphate deacetylase